MPNVPVLTDEIAAYWNERIHDLEMTDQPVGSLGFFDDLDEYRFDKLLYLPKLVSMRVRCWSAQGAPQGMAKSGWASPRPPRPACS